MGKTDTNKVKLRNNDHIKIPEFMWFDFQHTCMNKVRRIKPYWLNGNYKYPSILTHYPKSQNTRSLIH